MQNKHFENVVKQIYLQSFKHPYSTKKSLAQRVNLRLAVKGLTTRCNDYK